MDIHLYVHAAESEAKLDQILNALTNLQKQDKDNMALLDDKITALTAQVQANTDVTASASLMINGFATLLADAIAAATAAGATAAQLAALTDLQTKVAADDTNLAAAIAARTPTQTLR